MNRFLSICLAFSASVSFAQNNRLDSLQQALKAYDAQQLEWRKNLMPDEDDTTKVTLLKDIGREHMMVSDYGPAKKFTEEALALGQQIGFKRGMANCYNNLGIIYRKQGNYAESLNNHFAALTIRQQTGDKKGIASSYTNIGIIYYQQGNYTEALKHDFAALQLHEENGNKNGIAAAYTNIGLVYWQQEKYPEALQYHEAALKIYQEVDDPYGIAVTYNNIGIVYEDQGNLQEALTNYFAALKIQEEIGEKYAIAGCYYSIGVNYRGQGNYTEGLKYLLASLKIKEAIGDTNGIAGDCIEIGITKLKMQAAKEGKDWLMKGLQLAKKVESVSLIANCYDWLGAADSTLGNFRGAFEHQKQYMLYRDRLLNEANTRKQTQTEMQYEFDKKEAETKLLSDAELKKQKLVRNGFVSGFAVVLLFAGVFFRQRNKTKLEKLRSDALLLNILPAEVADEIKNTGTAKAKAFTMVTVMLTDFKDFTIVSEKISAELLVDEIHTCFSAFDHILHKYRIEKIKTIGDAYLCTSGLPVSNYTHATDMVNAAFEIRDYILNRKKEKEARGEIAFELRVGIHTGPVVAGVVGVKKYAYDIWGDTVNIAARMEQNSEAGKINISGATYELVKDKFSCTHRGKIQAKHKGEIDMYFVERI